MVAKRKKNSEDEGDDYEFGFPPPLSTNIAFMSTAQRNFARDTFINPSENQVTSNYNHATPSNHHMVPQVPTGMFSNANDDLPSFESPTRFACYDAFGSSICGCGRCEICRPQVPAIQPSITQGGYSTPFVQPSDGAQNTHVDHNIMGDYWTPHVPSYPPGNTQLVQNNYNQHASTPSLVSIDSNTERDRNSHQHAFLAVETGMNAPASRSSRGHHQRRNSTNQYRYSPEARIHRGIPSPPLGENGFGQGWVHNYGQTQAPIDGTSPWHPDDDIVTGEKRYNVFIQNWRDQAQASLLNDAPLSSSRILQDRTPSTLATAQFNTPNPSVINQFPQYNFHGVAPDVKVPSVSSRSSPAQHTSADISDARSTPTDDDDAKLPMRAALLQAPPIVRITDHNPGAITRKQTFSVQRPPDGTPDEVAEDITAAVLGVCEPDKFIICRCDHKDPTHVIVHTYPYQDRFDWDDEQDIKKLNFFRAGAIALACGIDFMAQPKRKIIITDEMREKFCTPMPVEPWPVRKAKSDAYLLALALAGASGVATDMEESMNSGNGAFSEEFME